MQWQKSTDGGATYTDIEGATEPVYTLNPTFVDDETLYVAVFTNAGGATASDAAHLTVYGIPVQITADPKDVTVDEGAPASFTAHATGDDSPTVQWQVSSDLGDTFTNVLGATSDTYTTPPTTPDDNGDCYAAVFSNSIGSATTRCAALNVNPPVIALPPSAPQGLVVSQTAPSLVTLTWRAPDSDGGSAVTGYVVAYSAGQSGSGTSFGADARTATFTGLASAPYTFSIWANNAVGIGARVTVALTLRVSPTENVSRANVTAGDRFTVSGIASAGDRLTLERAIPGQGYRAIASYLVDRFGRYSGSVAVTNSATYRVRGSTGLLSRSLTVVVQDRLTLIASRVGLRTYTLSGTVYPAMKGQSVKLYSHQKKAGVFKPLAIVITDSAGRWSYKRTYPLTGVWAFEAASVATVLNASQTVTLLEAVR